MNTPLYILIQLAAALLLAPLVNGVIKKVKAFSQKRQGPPLQQMYLDLYKLLQKDTVVSETASWVYHFAPYLNFVTALLAFLFFPVTFFQQTISFGGDIILAVYLLGLGRFFMALGGLDTGSTFGGMGASREMMISALIEPALLVSLLTLGLMSGSTSVESIMSVNLQGSPLSTNPFALLILIALFIILLAETARIPVDDPSTHLELTMVHEAMLLEYSGRHLALMEYAAVIKQLLFITILANFFFPLEPALASPLPALLLGLIVYVLKVLIIAVLVAVTEISTVKLRFFSIPNLAAISFVLSFLGFMQFFIIGR